MVPGSNKILVVTSDFAAFAAVFPLHETLSGLFQETTN